MALVAMPHVLALDEGTTSARTILFDDRARSLAVDQIPVHSSFPRDGWVEQDAEQIWRAQLSSVQRAIEKSGVAPSDIAALGITNQRETTIVWDRKTGKPVSPAIVWQCRRTADRCRKLVDEGHGGSITASTGLVVDAYFSGTKIGWILDNVPDARSRAEAGELAFGTVDSWLVWKLTGGREHIIDRTNASRTLLMNLASGQWDPAMLALLGVPAGLLPRIVASSGVIGTTDASLFGAEIPIAGIAGDQQAALFGQACFRPGLSKNTYGTGCFLLLNTGGQRPVSQNKLLATAAASTAAGQEFALEGSIFIAGAAVQWLRDSLGLIETAAASEAVAASVPDTGGVFVVPAFVGLGAPHWSSHARGLITGLTRASGRAHIVRATLESIAYQTRELVDAMEADSGEELAELRVDGGAAANDFLMQFQADILGKPVVRPSNVETTALGAAFLAGLATDVWKDLEEIESFWGVDKRFEPRMPKTQREALYAGWKTAVARSIS
jgi:glycerol kinase